MRPLKQGVSGTVRLEDNRAAFTVSGAGKTNGYIIMRGGKVFGGPLSAGRGVVNIPDGNVSAAAVTSNGEIILLGTARGERVDPQMVLRLLKSMGTENMNQPQRPAAPMPAPSAPTPMSTPSMPVPAAPDSSMPQQQNLANMAVEPQMMMENYINEEYSIEEDMSQTPDMMRAAPEMTEDEYMSGQDMYESDIYRYSDDMGQSGEEGAYMQDNFMDQMTENMGWETMPTDTDFSGTDMTGQGFMTEEEYNRIIRNWEGAQEQTAMPTAFDRTIGDGMARDSANDGFMLVQQDDDFNQTTPSGFITEEEYYRIINASGARRTTDEDGMPLMNGQNGAGMGFSDTNAMEGEVMSLPVFKSNDQTDDRSQGVLMNAFPQLYPMVDWSMEDYPNNKHYLHAKVDGRELHALPEHPGLLPVGLPPKARFANSCTGKGYWIF